MKTILLPLVVAALAVPGYAQNARTPQQLDAGLDRPLGPSVSTQGDLTATLWKENLTNNMHVAVSHDNGNTWGAPVRVDDDLLAASKYSGDMGLVVDGGNIYATWSDDRAASFDADIQFTMSTDGGLTWTANVPLPKGFPTGANDVKNWNLHADGLNLAVVCAVENDLGGYNEEGFLTVSTDGGVTWGAAVAVSLHPNGATDVDGIWSDMSNGKIHIAWQDNSTNGLDNEGFYSCYDIATGLFTSQDVLVSAGMVGGHVEWDIRIATNGTTVAIAMQADNLPTASADVLHVNVSTDGGVTWGGDVQVGGYLAGTNDVDNPVVMVNAAGTVIVAAEDNRNGGDELFAHTSVDGGVTWTESASLGGGGYPAIGGDGDYVAINWTGPSYPEGSMAVASNDGGVTWGTPLDMAAGWLGDADYAEMAFNAKYANFVAVWLDDTATATNQLIASGFRIQSLFANGPVIAGQPVNFSGSGWSLSEAGNTFMVVVSTANGYGSAFLPGDGRDLGIGMSPTLLSTSTLPALSGVIAADGSASTPVLTMPARFPVGTSLYCMAISRGVGFDSLSDVVTVVVQ